MIVCATSSPSIDKLFIVSRLHVGQIHRPVKFTRVPGGKALNAARAARALGGSSRVVAIAAGSAGRWIADTLEREGVESTLIWSRGESRSALSVSDASTGTLTEFYEDSPAVTDDVWERFERAVVAALGPTDWLSLSGSLAAGAPIEGYARLVRSARERHALVAVDARGPALAAAVAEGPDLVKVNTAEAGELLGTAASGGRETLSWGLHAARDIRRAAGGDGHAVAVTCGVDGMALVDGRGVGWLGKLRSHGPFPVGSGDAALAAMLTALSAGQDYPEALALALGAAAANAFVPGAGRLAADAARALAASSSVQRLGPV